MANPTNALAYQPLLDSIKNRDCIAVIGAGISSPDYPLWNALLTELLRDCGIRAEDVPAKIARDKASQADFARARNPAAYYDTLNRVFARRKSPECATRYHLLARIGFCSYINLNFDPVLCDVLNLHTNISVSTYPVLQPKHLRDGNVFHLHGRIDKDSPAEDGRIVLSKEDFKTAYDPIRSRVHAFLQSVFDDHDVCFLGCNPEEPNLKRILGSCESFQESLHGVTSPSRPRRFLLWSHDSAEPMLKKCGVNLVNYAKVDGAYTGLLDVLKHLAGDRPISHRQGDVESRTYASNDGGQP
tara:strand:- start:8488 stop:9387 length:900 start_codon:yes stop_codon:yes gene_type:complete